jgi:3-methyladenine DNA glycosylase/8-oxoguanine DNA glycosylase
MRSPTFFEDVIKTVTSCNVTWPSTVNMNRRLCEAMGSMASPGPSTRSHPGGAHFVHSFPAPERLARVRAATLRSRCSVGYRDARIIELARLFTLSSVRGGIDSAWFENPGTSDDAIHAALLELPGIGPYAAANIMQLLGRYARLPLDTESLRHAKSILGMTGSEREILKRMHTHYAPFGEHAFRSYWLELWEFYESHRGPAWTWERETTGKSFTAALLKEWPSEETRAE